ncbi:MAG: hypothetical protein JWN64_491 [Parcubacteria group bacterium]|nr:hypothetical protein [Parcubacteria group bacterium]
MFASYRLDDITVRVQRVVKVRLPAECFSVLEQVRKTYEIDEDLVPSFLSQGQLTPGMVAALDPHQARVYVDEINAIFDSHHTVHDLIPVELDGDEYYLAIFAGHRRHATSQHVELGIKTGKYVPTENYESGYLAELHFDMDAERAIELQFQENRHTTPPLHQEAEAAWRFYRHKRRKNPGLTPGQYARTIGRTTEWVKSALRFCSLPPSIQALVTGDNAWKLRLPYGALVDLARLAEGYELLMGEKLAEEGMHRWVRDAVASQLNATTFGRKVSEYLEDLRSQKAGQLSLFNLEESDVAHEHRMRRTVKRELVPALWKIIAYFEVVENFRRAGVLGKESYMAPIKTSEELHYYSPASPIRMLVAVVERIENIIPGLAELARKEGRGGWKRLLKSHPEMAEFLPGLRAFAKLEEVSTASPLH